jgi:hypothetical protein
MSRVQSVYLLHNHQHGVAELARKLGIAHGSTTLDQEADLVISWSDTARPGSARPRYWWLNHPRCVALSRQVNNMRRVLSASGVDLESGEPKLFTRLSIYVFHLRVIALFRAGMWSGKRRWHHPCELAIRAVQALQLDFARVDVVLTSRGIWKVWRVDATPPLDERLVAIFAGAIRRYVRRMQQFFVGPRDPLFGTDLEFILVTPQGKLSPASLYVPRRGRVGHDALRLNGSRLGKRLYPIVELRPQPARNPESLIRHLYACMQMAAHKIRRKPLRWFAGAMPLGKFSLGGHLHISRFWLNSSFLRALDLYLAIPLMMCEAGSSVGRRGKYGKFSDVRKQFHGGFEYRTLPSWIISIELTRGVLALFYVLAHHFESLPAERWSRLADAHVIEAYMRGNKQRLLPLVRESWDVVAKLPRYATYQRWLEPFRAQSLAATPWNEADDIRRSWKIPPFHS